MITLKKEKEFSKVYQKGHKKHTKYVIIIFLKNNLNEKRFGFVASKKTGNAVKRNRIKRLFREVVSLNYNKFKENYDYIIIGKAVLKDNIDSLKYDTMEKDILKGIIKWEKYLFSS